jgi:hypothetical protein
VVPHLARKGDTSPTEIQRSGALRESIPGFFDSFPGSSPGGSGGHGGAPDLTGACVKPLTVVQPRPEGTRAPGLGATSSVPKAGAELPARDHVCPK